MSARTCTLLLFATLTACGHDDGSEQAARAFASFQQALQERNESACRELLTRESRAVLAEIPWDTVSSQQPLHVVDARRATSNGSEYHVDVTDPNQQGAPGRYIVVREYGRLVVDLVASAGLTAQTIEASGSREQFEPTTLQPADFDRIREYELKQPLGNPRGN